MWYNSVSCCRSKFLKHPPTAHLCDIVPVLLLLLLLSSAWKLGPCQWQHPGSPVPRPPGNSRVDDQMVRHRSILSFAAIARNTVLKVQFSSKWRPLSTLDLTHDFTDTAWICMQNFALVTLFNDVINQKITITITAYYIYFTGIPMM